MLASSVSDVLNYFPQGLFLPVDTSIFANNRNNAMKMMSLLFLVRFICRFSPISRPLLARFSPVFHPILSRFSPNSFPFLAHFLLVSYPLLPRFSPDFCPFHVHSSSSYRQFLATIYKWCIWWKHIKFGIILRHFLETHSWLSSFRCSSTIPETSLNFRV